VTWKHLQGNIDIHVCHSGETLRSDATNTLLCLGVLFAELSLGSVSEIDDPNEKVSSYALHTLSPELTLHA
jgi:hypothetical protein